MAAVVLVEATVEEEVEKEDGKKVKDQEEDSYKTNMNVPIMKKQQGVCKKIHRSKESK